MLQKITFLIVTLCLLSVYSLQSKTAELTTSKHYLHPGMAQSRQDLEYMKQQVLAGKEPWKSAFERLKKETSSDFEPKPFTHVSVGPYGKNSIGGSELSESANKAYAFAILWYITNDQFYARKGISILNAWANVLWDFSGNNAKLNVGLTAFNFLNAAEILKYTSSGWKDSEIRMFERLMLTVYYPTVRDFFTEANGNWDAAIINTLFCIGIFTDNHAIFDTALKRFYHGPGNSGITKYIYPGGQLQETTRDWGHVQLGIGEFSKAAQVAWTQGINLYKVAENRLAQGFEYTSRFLLGGTVPAYGQISERDKDTFRDIYESIYDYYLYEKNTEMSFTGRVIQEQTRAKSSLGVLTSLRIHSRAASKNPVIFSASEFVSDAGAVGEKEISAPLGSIVVQCGESIQDALNKASGTMHWIVLSKGIHELAATLQIPNNVTLVGHGKETILFLKPDLQLPVMIAATKDLHDIVIRDLLIEGATSTETPSDPNDSRRKRSYMSAPSREGILFSADHDHQMRNIRIEHVTIQNFTQNGLSVRGTDQLSIHKCNFSGNGSNVVPGAGFHHNLHLTHVDNAEITDSRFDDSIWGNGIDISFSKNIQVSNSETSRNKRSGIYCTESSWIAVTSCLAEGNDLNGFLFETLMNGSEHVTFENNQLINNAGEGLVLEKCNDCRQNKTISRDNGREATIEINKK